MSEQAAEIPLGVRRAGAPSVGSKTASKRARTKGSTGTVIDTAPLVAAADRMDCTRLAFCRVTFSRGETVPRIVDYEANW